MAWGRRDIAGGVVNTRAAQDLGSDELVKANACRVKIGDPVQLYRDLGRDSSAYSGLTDDVIELGFASFENAADRLIAVTASGIYTALASGGAFAQIQAISSVTAAAIVHDGDRYFVGTDQGNYVVESDNTARLMGMIRGAAGIQPLTEATSINYVTGAKNPFTTNDVVTYYITEYDSERDLESPWRYVAVPAPGSITAPGAIELDFTIDYGPSDQVNPLADKWRIYRHYFGTGTDAQDEADDSYPEALGGVLIAGLVDEINIDYTLSSWIDEGFAQNLDPSIPYPLLPLNQSFDAPIYALLVAPGSFTRAVIFSGSMVVDDPSVSKQIIRFSPSGRLEYQPSPYFVPIVTEHSDSVLAMHTVNNILLVLTDGGVHRINWLPYAGDVQAGAGRVQQEVVDEGTVGRHASCRVQTESGEAVVWLSRQGLRITTGNGWADACRDWSVDAAGLSASLLSDSVLYNDERNHRLVLHARTSSNDQNTWHFYYHPHHLKRSGFKAIGPHSPTEMASDYVRAAATGRLSGVSQAWVAVGSTVYKESVGVTSETMNIRTPHDHYDNRMNEVVCKEIGLTHIGQGENSIRAKVHFRTRNETGEGTVGFSVIPGSEYDETSLLSPTGAKGNWISVEIKSDDSGDHVWGPLYLDTEHGGGGQ